MAPRYRVTLEAAEREELLALTRSGKTSSKVFVSAAARSAAAQAAGRDVRRRVRGSSDCAGLLAGTLRAAPLDGPPAGGRGRGPGPGTERLADDRPADPKKNELKPLKKYWRNPTRGSAVLVACMEDVLAVYARP